MPKINKFPKAIAVSIEDGETEDGWLDARVNVIEHAVIGEKTKVAIYKLAEVREVQGVASTKLIRE